MFLILKLKFKLIYLNKKKLIKKNKIKKNNYFQFISTLIKKFTFKKKKYVNSSSSSCVQQ